ncbi:MAG: tRNA (N6-isopentenyl adenosine(37)-C2)-methylthiotransferase MiaB, partial [Pseudomonadota bacterium]
DGAPQIDISFPEIEKFDCLPPAQVHGPTAFVSVMEGCSKYCSFCVVPYTRGEEVSRALDDVLTEVAELAVQGVKEVTLLGQNVNAYRGVMADSSVADLAQLLDYVCDIPGIERVRYTTSHPREFTPHLIDAYTRLPKLVSHVHLPVQSGSDRVLYAMKRGYTALEYKAIVRQLRAARPELSISSDFIVGFPGETEADFNQTVKLIDDVGFDSGFSFLYSARPGTPAAQLHDDTPLTVRQARLAIVQEKLEAHAQRISRTMVGTRQRILIEGPSKRNPSELKGRTDNNRVVNLTGPQRLVGEFIDVTITHALHHTLRAEITASNH